MEMSLDKQVLNTPAESLKLVKRVSLFRCLLAIANIGALVSFNFMLSLFVKRFN